MYTAIHASCSSRSRTVQGESTNSRPRRRVSHDITYAKCFCKCPGMSSYRIIGLKVPWNEQLQERGGGAASSAVPTGRLGRIRGSDLLGPTTKLVERRAFKP